MHPRVVVALVPPADEQQLVGRRGRCRGAAGPGRRAPGRERRRRGPSCSRRGSWPARSGPRSTPAGLARSCFIVTPDAPAPQQQRDQPGRAGREPGPLDDPLLQRRLRAQPALGAQRELAVDLPVVHRAVLGRQHGRGEPCGVAHREQVEDQVVVVALERGRRRQDHVGVPGGLVDVDVDRRHEVQAGRAPGRARRRRASTRPGCRPASAAPGPGRRRASRSPRAAPTPAARRRTPAARAPGCATRRGGPCRSARCRPRRWPGW